MGLTTDAKIKFITKPIRSMGVYLILMLIAYSKPLLASQSCWIKASTELEKIYCEAVMLGEAMSLPAFEAFQSYDEDTQRLMLQVPAQRLGIPISQPKKKKVVKRRKQAPQCEINKMSIACGGHLFFLALNVPNSKLDQSALSENYRLKLPVFNGDFDDDKAVGAYLSQAYAKYIESMLAIGLGGSTMRYTSFYHSFDRYRYRQDQFVKRFETMFEYLKKDKKSIPLSTEPPDYFPHQIQQCSALNKFVIICSDERLNWVYTRKANT